MTLFHDLHEYMAIPRVESLRLSPDGRRLVMVVKDLAPDRKKYQTALWEIAADGAAEPRRLTRSAQGESGPAFLPDGTLLFLSDRPDPGAEPDGTEQGAALWALPASGGEARPVAARPGGISAAVAARDAGTVVCTAATLPGAAEADGERRKKREDAGVTAILHEDFPIRYWDHQLGPDQPRLFALPRGSQDATPGQEARDLTPDAGQALAEQAAAVTPDGSAVVTGWWIRGAGAERRSELVAIDLATGGRRTLIARDGVDFLAPVISPNGRAVVCVAATHASTDEPADQALWLVPLDGAPPRELTAGLDLWPGGPAWSPDSARVYFSADERGRRPVFAVDVQAAAIERLTSDDAAYTHLSVSPDGRSLYALRSAIDSPPLPVRIDSSAGTSTPLPAPTGSLALPGRVAEITAAAPDGTDIRGWLVLPDGPAGPTGPTGPAPLLLWVHGGPHSSWNAWSWRWNPWIMAAHGYAVLLPDPALSTGYGQDHIRRGHGRWGEATFDDVMAITDAALARDDIDESRTGMMGGSFGGYMANWIAGQTGQFAAIVTHASLWKLDIMITSDENYDFTREFGDLADQPGRWHANDPARHADKIRTPMLVIHGNSDYRVPIGHALSLWWDLIRNRVDAKFLYYPDENHWILSPGNAVVWYETVLAFLAEHVLGQEWHRPGDV